MSERPTGPWPKRPSRGSQVDFTGVDLLDGTSVLDIKPFEPNLDLPPASPSGDGG
jgi:tRNA (Thr-GGU) A37 N-methylase